MNISVLGYRYLLEFGLVSLFPLLPMLLLSSARNFYFMSSAPGS